MLSPFLVFFVLFIAYPMVMSLYYSFDYNLNTANFVGVRNYVRLTRDPCSVWRFKIPASMRLSA